MDRYEVVQLQENKYAVAEYGVVVALFGSSVEAHSFVSKMTN
jgi:hypothetical protein